MFKIRLHPMLILPTSEKQTNSLILINSPIPLIASLRPGKSLTSQITYHEPLLLPIKHLRAKLLNRPLDQCRPAVDSRTIIAANPQYVRKL
mgnify:CR=1 FL=1